MLDDDFKKIKRKLENDIDEALMELKKIFSVANEDETLSYISDIEDLLAEFGDELSDVESKYYSDEDDFEFDDQDTESEDDFDFDNLATAIEEISMQTSNEEENSSWDELYEKKYSEIELTLLHCSFVKAK